MPVSPQDPSSDGMISVAPRMIWKRTWAAVLATFAASLGFAALKFVMVNELALDFNPAAHQPLPIEWMERIVQRCIHLQQIEEAITQGVAAMITLGVIAGYFINAPLAGVWRCGRLFAMSGLGVAIGSLLVLVVNPWVILFLVGGAYGAACAARGKTVPLLSTATGLSNTFTSGLINAAMVIGLLAGTMLGTGLADLHEKTGGYWPTHLIVMVALLLSALAGVFVTPPEPAPIPFTQGARDLFGGTWRMFLRHWPLLVGGGLAWGVISAMSLAMYVDVQERLNLDKDLAATLALFSVVGAVVGNLLSDRWSRRRYVLTEFFLMAVAVGGYPYLVQPAWGYAGAAVAAAVIGTLFAAGANVLDARFLRLAAEEGQSGRGSTLMSLTHSIFIFVVGSGAAVALLMGWVSAINQFALFAVGSLLTMGAAAFAKLRSTGPSESQDRSGRMKAV